MADAPPQTFMDRAVVGVIHVVDVADGLGFAHLACPDEIPKVLEAAEPPSLMRDALQASTFLDSTLAWPVLYSSSAFPVRRGCYAWAGTEDNLVTVAPWIHAAIRRRPMLTPDRLCSLGDRTS